MAAAVKAMRSASTGVAQRSDSNKSSEQGSITDFQAVHDPGGSAFGHAPLARKLASLEHTVMDLYVKQKLHLEALQNEISKLPLNTAKALDELLAGSSDMKAALAPTAVQGSSDMKAARAPTTVEGDAASASREMQNRLQISEKVQELQDRLAVSETAANNEVVSISTLKAIEERLEKLERFREHVALEENALVGAKELKDTSDEVVTQTPPGEPADNFDDITLAQRRSSRDSIYSKTATNQMLGQMRDDDYGSILQNVRKEVNFLSAEGDAFHQRCLYRCVTSRPFNAGCIFAVVLNAIWLGYESDHLNSNVTWMYYVSISFNICFMIELAIRIMGLRRDFILGPDWAWNLLDALCVLLSIPDFFASSGMNVSFLRIVRLLKLSKALRLVRVLKIVRSLRLILTTVFYTLGSLFWSFVAMLFVAYNFAILLIQAVSLHVDDGVQFSSLTTDNFNSGLWNSILALFSMITGGQDWFEVAQDMGRGGGHVAEYLLMFWIFFATFGLVNVVVAVFCAQAVDAGESQRDLRLSKQSEVRTAKISELMDVFQMIDEHDLGSISWEQFHGFATDSQGGAILESNGLQLFALEPVWHMMTGRRDKDGEMDMPAFVMGFLRMSDEHMSTDLLLLSQSLKGLRSEVRESIDSLCNAITELRRRSSPQFSTTV